MKGEPAPSSNEPYGGSADFPSYRGCFRKHLGAEFLRQIVQREQMDRDAKHLFEFDLQAAEVKERCIRQRVDQNIEITAIGILAAGYRAEHPWIDRPEATYQGANAGSMPFECD